MTAISATPTHSAAHPASNVGTVHKPDAKAETNVQATKRSEEAERAKKIFDSRPSQTRLNFQHAVNATQSASGVKHS